MFYLLVCRKREASKPIPKTGQAFDGPYELTIEGNAVGVTETKPAVLDQDPSNHEYAYAEVENNREKTTIAEPDPDNVQEKPEEDSYGHYQGLVRQ